MDESIIDKFYEKLVACLPMDDASFRASLRTAGLLPGDLKSAVTSKSTRAEMAEHFLDYGINNNIGSFSQLLTVMKNSKRDKLKVLVYEIQEETGSVELDVIPSTAKKAKVEICLLDEVQKKLKTAYNHICYSDRPHCYIQLALVRDEMCNIRDRKLNEITRHTLQGQVDEILKIKEPLKTLEDVFHFKNSPCPRLLLVLGAPGIGKTTFANEICLKWAKDTKCFISNDYDLVILIRLRAIQETTLQQEMIDAVGSEAAYDELLTKSHGNRCLIILEGLDEISAHWQQNDAMFCKLVKTTTFLSHANILVTSRPHACIDLHRDIKDHTRTIEIVGFDKPQIKEHAESYFHNSNTAEKFMEQINNDPHISSLCYVPLCLNMVLECFKYNNEILHTTLTELYQSFIISKVDKSIRFKKYTSLGTVLDNDKQCIKELVTILSDVPDVLSKEALETMFLLSKLAYKSYFEWYEHYRMQERNNWMKERNPKIIYTSKDLAHCNITNSGNDACGLLKATNTLFATGNTAVYTFNHLSVQEYFCALYISLLPEDQQLQLLKDHITHYPHMWPFYAGITKLRSSMFLQYVQLLLLHSKPLSINLPEITLGEKYKFEIIVVLNSIYEAQLLSDFYKHEIKFVNLSGCPLHPYDCMSISYFMSIVPITHLHLIGCGIGDQEAEMLARWKDLKPSLKVLDLSRNHITDKGMESIVKIIKSSPNLTHFVVGNNLIGVESFSLLKSEHLIHLDVGNINMTEVGTCALGEYFKFNKSLQSLDISNNNIKDNGLTRTLSGIPTLVRLIATKCYLTCAGALNVSEVLRINKTLKYLDISENPIGDDGISAVSDGLHVNTMLIQLVAYSCEFYSKGARTVAKMLQTNKTLKYLDISGNHIEDDGITAVTCSIENNTTLIELMLHDCKFYSRGLQSINKMLMINKSLIKLGIADVDDDEDDGEALTTVLETFLKSNCKLSQLTISGSKRKTERCISKAKVVTTSSGFTGFTEDHCRAIISSRLQYLAILKKSDQPEDDPTKDETDNTEEWLITTPRVLHRIQYT